MAFSKEDFDAWHCAKREREFKPTRALEKAAAATCIHCHRPFGWTEGTITDEIAICDVCNGD